MPGDNLPTGLAPGNSAQLPLQRLPSSSSLLHCPRGEKNSPEPAGTVPKFSFLAQSPGKTAKSGRESSALSHSLSLILPLSLSLPVKKEAIQSLSLPATGVWGKQLSISHGAFKTGNEKWGGGGGHCREGRSTFPSYSSTLVSVYSSLGTDPLPPGYQHCMVL